MKFNNTGAQTSTVTRDVNDFLEKTDNIFKAVSIMAKRSAQINEKLKEELMEKLEEFALTQEQLDEVFENQEQIAVSKFYESLPKPWAIAMKELLNDEIYMREADVEQEEDVDESKQDA
jgi:DNA-directed RNA polymerase subunit K/omega